MLFRPIIKGAFLLTLGGLSACQTTDAPSSRLPTPISPQTSTAILGGAVEADIVDKPSETAELPDGFVSPNNSVTPLDQQSEIGPIAPPDNTTANSAFSPAFSDYLPGWDTANLTPALTAFARNCPIWEKQDPQAALMTERPDFGEYKDWQALCVALPPAPYDENWARWFFESYFLPANLLSTDVTEGLLTGYYEPEIEVRHVADSEFSEPILALPDDDSSRLKSRADIYSGQTDYTAHAYGRPIDVFFMQVQGSGRIKFSDETIKRAAYGGNNGYKYKSIGGVLIARGEMTRDEASKQSIEEWMNKAGVRAARALMNENPRYIYFALEDIELNEGPKGSMRVPLTAKGSLAVDPKSRPYGVPVWLETILPQFSGDYKGTPESLLVIAQDSGSAIKGEGRGDLFFGSGDLAGELAGVMKHDVTMTHLLPRNLVLAELGFRE